MSMIAEVCIATQISIRIRSAQKVELLDLVDQVSSATMKKSDCQSLRT
jgi:hypothetical protein